VELGLVGQAAGMFAVTNVDDIVILALFFGQATDRGAAARAVVGQYLGIAGILAASIVGALGAGLLPDTMIPYLGLVPLLLGLSAAWRAWRDRHATDEEPTAVATGPAVLAVAAVTFANGGDNIALYTPVFRIIGVADAALTLAVFAVCTALWCLAGQLAVSHQRVIEMLQRSSRWLVPVVFVVLGSYIVGRSGLMGVFR